MKKHTTIIIRLLLLTLMLFVPIVTCMNVQWGIEADFPEGEQAFVDLVFVFIEYRDYLQTLEYYGGLELYRLEMIYNLNQIINYLSKNNKIEFLQGSNKYGAMLYVAVIPLVNYIPPKIFVPDPNHPRWDDQRIVNQAIANEVSHIVLNTLDVGEHNQIENIPVAEWPKYSDWYEIFVMWYYQGGLQKIENFTEMHL